MVIPAETGSVALVRHTLAGLAESAGMDPETIGDLKTVVTEACMNSVAHAYEDGEGLIWIDATPRGGSLEIVVSDAGKGIQPRIDVGAPDGSLRLGFSLIAALCSGFQISGGHNQGTSITMRLPLSRSETAAPDEPLPPSPGERVSNGAELPGEVQIASASELLPAVLPRAISAFGSRRDLSVDQISDAILLADAISAGTPASLDLDEVKFSLSDGDGGIDLRVGPLDTGDGERLRDGLKISGVGGTMETLADEVRVDTAEAGEYLVFTILPA
jgi:anti-sigma regulatory factor (Ser/Thr protein kinase)